MRRFHNRLLGFVFSVVGLANASGAGAAPLTGGTGPGGVETVSLASNLTLWLNADAQTGAISGNPLPTWNDQSGKGNNATQGTVNRQPIWNSSVVNGRAAVAFDGTPNATGDRYVLGAANLVDLTTANGASVHSVTQLTGFTGPYPEYISIQSGLANNENLQLIRSNNGSYFDYSFGISGQATGRVASAAYNASWQMYGLKYNGVGIGASANFSPSLNSNSQAVIAAGGYASNPDNFSVVGGDSTDRNDQRWQGQMAEIAVFNRQLNSAESLIVDNYLSAKYNVGSTTVAIVNQTLGANDYYAGDLASKGDFDLDVFGVGRVNASNQLTSTGSAGFGIEVAALADGAFVMAGHASGPNGTTSSDMPGGLRWERSWYIDTTGVTTADLAFDWNDDGNTAAFDPSFDGLYFRSANSGLFTLIAVGSVDTVNQRVDFLGVNLDANDGYYTLGIIPVPEPATFTLLGLGMLGMAVKSRRRRRAA